MKRGTLPSWPPGTVMRGGSQAGARKPLLKHQACPERSQFLPTLQEVSGAQRASSANRDRGPPWRRMRYCASLDEESLRPLPTLSRKPQAHQAPSLFLPFLPELTSSGGGSWVVSLRASLGSTSDDGGGPQLWGCLLLLLLELQELRPEGREGAAAGPALVPWSASWGWACGDLSG